MPRLSLVGVFAGALHAPRHWLGGVDSLSPTLDVGGPVGGDVLRYFVTVAGVPEAQPRARLFDGGIEFGRGGAEAPRARIAHNAAGAPRLDFLLDNTNYLRLTDSALRLFLRLALELQGQDASAGTPLVDSGNVNLIAKYWDGAASVDRTAFISHDAVDVTPATRIQFGIAQVGVLANLTSAREYVPSGDTLGSIGTAGLRWGLIRGVTVTSGDFEWENGWRLTEAERLGLGEGIALVSPSGKVVANWKE